MNEETHIENFENGLTCHKEPCKCQTCVDARNCLRRSTPNDKTVEPREQYAERYLRGRLFQIVEHYDKTAVANPPVVGEAIDDIIATLVTSLQQSALEEKKELVKSLENCKESTVCTHYQDNCSCLNEHDTKVHNNAINLAIRTVRYNITTN